MTATCQPSAASQYGAATPLTTTALIDVNLADDANYDRAVRRYSSFIRILFTIFFYRLYGIYVFFRQYSYIIS